MVTALVLAGGSARAQTAVTACGLIVSGPAVLAGDLDCGGFDPALTIDVGKLDLAGFSLTGGPVLCAGRCEINGPGTLDEIAWPDDGKVDAFVTGVTVNGPVRATGRLVVEVGADSQLTP